MSEVKVNKISPRTNCGTVQLGDSGDTITIPSGATITNNGTQTGFGRTGTVNWDTTKKTASFTAVSGNGYFVDTSSSAITMTLPASPSAGDIVSVKDYSYSFETNNLTVARNGSPIGGGSAVDNLTYDTNGDFITFIYVDATRGWLITDDSTNTDNTGTQLIAATGGTVTTCGDFKIHTFTGPGTFCVTAGAGPLGVADYLVIAGGGGGGRDDGGGGGAGGFRESHNPTTSGCYTASPLAAPNSPTSASLPFTVGAYPVTVGSGGAGATGTPNSTGAPGSNSVLSTITSTGGGGGSRDDPGGLPGGSGGGGHSPARPGGTGNTPPVSPPQGNNGGTGRQGGAGTPYLGGGGGGAGAAGSPGPSGKAGGVGSPLATAFIGPTAPSYGTSGPNPGRYFAGGGGGNEVGDSGVPTSLPQGSGGSGGGGAASGPGYPRPPGTPGTANTGGGGGGGGVYPGPQVPAGAGGSGIVMIRYKYQ